MRQVNKPVIVFDVNETLLDLSALRRRFAAVLPDELVGLWFARMLFNSAVATMSGVYAPFDRQGVDALISTARSVDVELSEERAAEVVDGMRELPAHPDVVPALEQLKTEGFRLATLTNSSTEVVRDQIHNAGLDEYFERLLSVDVVRRFKPDAAVYRYAADALGVAIGELRLVAAHAWDVSGAIRAGARAAFVARGGAQLGLLSEKPDIIGPDLIHVAEAIVSR